MKKREVIIWSVSYSIVLGIVNFYSIVASHEFYYIILPFLADPITHSILYMSWFTSSVSFRIFGLFFFIPIFWPIVVYILIKIKNRLAPYVILLSIYVFIICISLYRLINEPDMIGKTVNSLAIYVEPIGILVFVIGQVGIFYMLRLKKEGRLH